MVTIRNDELQRAIEAMGALLPERMPAQLAMKLRRMLRAAAPVAKDMEEERQKLLKQYAKLTEAGELASAPESNAAVFESVEAMRGFQTAYLALCAVTSEQPEALTAEDLEGISCKGEVLIMLGPLFAE